MVTKLEGGGCEYLFKKFSGDLIKLDFNEIDYLKFA